jgi:uncharacterized protein YjbI with pentapeptide repeats
MTMRRPEPQAIDWMAALFTGRTFAVKGRFEDRAQEDIPKLIQAEGGAIVADVAANLDFLVAGATGATGPVQQAKQLNQKGASIKVLSEDEFFKLITPAPAEAVSVLRHGEEGARRWNQLRNYGDQRPVILKGADLHGLTLPELKLFAVTLDGVDLRDAVLTGGYLHECRGVLFQGACLAKTWFSLNTQRCTFDCANLQEVSNAGFTDCSCVEADLTGAGSGGFAIRGTRADFTRAKMVRFKGAEESNFTRAVLRDADLTEAKLPKSKWHNADCTGAAFCRADLNRSDFKNATLKNANLQGANLAWACLVKADLTGADLRGASLIEADLSGAIIDGADFEGAHLAGARLQGLDPTKAKGLEVRRAAPGGKPGKQVARLDQLLSKMDKPVKVSAVIDLPEGPVRVEASGKGGKYPWFHVYAYRGDTSEYLIHAQSFREIIYDKTRSYAHGNLRIDSITIETRNTPIPRRELKALTVAAWCEVFGVEAPAPAATSKGAAKVASAGGKQRSGGATAAKPARPRKTPRQK